MNSRPVQMNLTGKAVKLVMLLLSESEFHQPHINAPEIIKCTSQKQQKKGGVAGDVATKRGNCNLHSISPVLVKCHGHYLRFLKSRSSF